MDTSNNSTSTLQPLVSPPKEEQPVEKTPKVNYKIVFISCFVLIVAGAFYFLFNRPVQAEKYIVTENKESMTKETRLNLAAGLMGRDQLPLSFPQNIPVEFDFIAESFSRYYTALNKTEYVVSYITNVSVGSKFKEYEEYMIGDGYVLTQYEGSVLTDNSGLLHGSKGDSELHVTIYKVSVGSADINTPEEGTMVQLKYVDNNPPAVE